MEYRLQIEDGAVLHQTEWALFFFLHVTNFSMLAAMDENFNPNRMVHGSNDALGSSSINSNRNEEAPVADGDAPLAALLGALEDGEVAVAGDLVAIRAGPETYHPIKALKVLPLVVGHDNNNTKHKTRRAKQEHRILPKKR